MKRIHLTRVMICLALLVTQFALPAPASACSCIMPGLPVDEFIDADAVFTGRVIAISASHSPDPTGFYADGFWPYDVIFTVHKSWKSVTTTRMTLRTGHGEGDCGYQFVQGSDYLVYAYKLHPNRGDGMEANICSRTSEISTATEDLSYLNTLPTLPLTPVYNYSSLYIAGTALLLMTVLLLIVIILIRRRQQSRTTGELP